MATPKVFSSAYSAATSDDLETYVSPRQAFKRLSKRYPRHQVRSSLLAQEGWVYTLVLEGFFDRQRESRPASTIEVGGQVYSQNSLARELAALISDRAQQSTHRRSIQEFIAQGRTVFQNMDELICMLSHNYDVPHSNYSGVAVSFGGIKHKNAGGLKRQLEGLGWPILPIRTWHGRLAEVIADKSQIRGYFQLSTEDINALFETPDLRVPKETFLARLSDHMLINHSSLCSRNGQLDDLDEAYRSYVNQRSTFYFLCKICIAHGEQDPIYSKMFDKLGQGCPSCSRRVQGLERCLTDEASIEILMPFGDSVIFRRVVPPSEHNKRSLIEFACGYSDNHVFRRDPSELRRIDIFICPQCFPRNHGETLCVMVIAFLLGIPPNSVNRHREITPCFLRRENLSTKGDLRLDFFSSRDLKGVKIALEHQGWQHELAERALESATYEHPVIERIKKGIPNRTECEAAWSELPSSPRNATDGCAQLGLRDWLKARACQESNVHLITVEDIYRRHVVGHAVVTEIFEKLMIAPLERTDRSQIIDRYARLQDNLVAELSPYVNTAKLAVVMNK